MKAHDDYTFGYNLRMQCPISILFENNEIKNRGAFDNSKNVVKIII